jgi:hypothetical protein
MISMLAARRRAEDFAVALDGGPGARAAHPETAGLLTVATALRSHADAAPAPRPDFVSDLRERLMAEASAVLSPENAQLTLPPRGTGRRERRLVAAAASLVLVGGTASMAVAAQGALPGDALYPIKRGIEQAQAGLSSSPAGKGRDLLQQADDRLTEVQGLLGSGSLTSAPQVPQTLSDFTDQADQGAALLLQSYRNTRDPSTIRTLRQFAAAGVTKLTAISSLAPAEAQPGISRAALALRSIDRQASGLCSACAAGLPGLRIPPSLLTSEEVAKALKSARASSLNNSHPVVVPKGAVPASKSGGTKQPSSSGSGPSADPSPSSPLPSASPKDAKKDLGNVVKDPVGTVGGVVGSLGNGLNGVKQTLLPDPTDGP